MDAVETWGIELIGDGRDRWGRFIFCVLFML